MTELDREIALSAALHRLSDEFRGVHDEETVRRFMTCSYEHLHETARVKEMVPLLAERYAHDQLVALSRIEGHGTEHKLVLFICGNNSGRSQMAMGFLGEHAESGVWGWSGGSTPQAETNPVAVAAMAEIGIDISGTHPYPWTDEIVRAADVVVTMGADNVPQHEGVRYVDWDIPHISGLDLAEVRPIRDDIGHRVRTLLADL